jgi:hypothetical protein
VFIVIVIGTYFGPSNSGKPVESQYSMIVPASLLSESIHNLSNYRSAYPDILVNHMSFSSFAPCVVVVVRYVYIRVLNPSTSDELSRPYIVPPVWVMIQANHGGFPGLVSFVAPFVDHSFRRLISQLSTIRSRGFFNLQPATCNLQRDPSAPLISKLGMPQTGWSAARSGFLDLHRSPLRELKALLSANRQFGSLRRTRGRVQ